MCESENTCSEQGRKKSLLFDLTHSPLLSSQLPPVTRTYVTLCILTTAACALEVRKRVVLLLVAAWFCVFFFLKPLSSLPQLIAPFNIYYNARLIFQKGEVWRLITSFLYFGSLSE